MSNPHYFDDARAGSEGTFVALSVLVLIVLAVGAFVYAYVSPEAMQTALNEPPAAYGTTSP